jgi:mannose-1-phosphate guanylyltransferase
MLARVPSIRRIEAERDAPHPHLWAIVLTGGDGPDGRGRPSPRAHRWPLAPHPAATARARRLLDRTTRLVPATRVVTVTTRAHAAAWEAALDLGAEIQRVVQPVYRGRAAEVLLPLLKIAREDPEATVVVLPAPPVVDEEARFMRYVTRATWAVARRPEVPILIGAHPAGPVAHGWIEPGAPLEGLEDLAVRAVTRFVDDTTPAERRRLFESNALTSTLVFVGRAATLLRLAARDLPEVLEALEPLEEAFDTPEERLLCEAVYEWMPEADLGPLERAPELAVLPLPDVVCREPERDALTLLAS